MTTTVSARRLAWAAAATMLLSFKAAPLQAKELDLGDFAAMNYWKVACEARYNYRYAEDVASTLQKIYDEGFAKYGSDVDSYIRPTLGALMKAGPEKACSVLLTFYGPQGEFFRWILEP